MTAVALWLLSGLAEPVPAAVRRAAAAAVAVLAVARDGGLVRLPLPQNARQVPPDLLQREVRLGTLRFGFELGTGVRTYLPATAPYVVAAAVAFGALEFGQVLVAGLAFGAGRALTPLVRRASGDVTAWDRRLGERGRLVVLGSSAAVAILVVAGLVTAGFGVAG